MEVLWFRAKQLRWDGLSHERIQWRLMAEGYEDVPSKSAIWKRSTRENWPINPSLDVARVRARLEAERGRVLKRVERRMALFGNAPDTAWLTATKRCPECLSVGTGETCEQGHSFKVKGR